MEADILCMIAQRILQEHRDKLDTLASLLIQKEVINEEEIEKIFE